MWSVLDKLAEEFFISEIVEGECKNSQDILAREWAQDRGYSYWPFPADWNKHGKAAGHKRNIEQGIYGDILVAFWDGKSLGTRGMIREMQVNNKPWILVPCWGVNHTTKRRSNDAKKNSLRRFFSKTEEGRSPFERLRVHSGRYRD